MKHCFVNKICKLNLLFIKLTTFFATSKDKITQKNILTKITHYQKLLTNILYELVTHVWRIKVKENRRNCAGGCKYDLKGGNCRSENIIYKATNS